MTEQQREIFNLPLRLVRPSSLRQARSTSFKVDDIQPSMKAHGLIHPVWVKTRMLTPPDKELGDRVYELILGERRTIAATNLGWKTIAAEIRDDLSDLDIYLIHLEENDRRRPLTPLEQADAVERLMSPVDAGGFGISDTAEVAARLNISVSTVHQRLAMARASTKVRSALDEGKLYLGSLIAIASLHDTNEQDAALEACLPVIGEEPRPVRQVQRLVQDRFHLRLVSAPFDTKASLGGVGPCGDCPKRAGSDAQQSLFAVGADVTPPADDERCTDRACFIRKRVAWRDQRVESAKAAGLKVIDGAESASLYPSGRFVGHKSVAAGYLDLDEKPSGGGGKTFRELLGPSVVTVAVAVDGDDRVHDLCDKIVAMAALAKANALGPAEAPAPAQATQPSVTKSQVDKAPPPLPEKPSDEAVLLRKAQEAAADQLFEGVVERAERRTLNPKAWRFFLRGVARLAGDRLDPIVERRGWTDDGAGVSASAIVIARLDSLNETELRGLLAEMCAAADGVHMADDDDEHALRVAGRFCGIDHDANVKTQLQRLRLEAAPKKKKKQEKEPKVEPAKPSGPRCSSCGCANASRCSNDVGECVWADAEQSLCSFCAEVQALIGETLEAAADPITEPELMAELVNRVGGRYTKLRLDLALSDSKERRKVLVTTAGRLKAAARVIAKAPTAGATPSEEISVRERIVAFLRQRPEKKAPKRLLLTSIKEVPTSDLIREIMQATKDKLLATQPDPLELIAPTYDEAMEPIEALGLAELRARFLSVFGKQDPGLGMSDLRDAIARRLSGERAAVKAAPPAPPAPSAPKKGKK